MEQFCKIISLLQEIARKFPKYPWWFLSIFTCFTKWHIFMQLFGILTNCVRAYVCVFGRKLQIELQVVPQTFDSACLTTPIGIHFPSFCVSHDSKLSTMVMGKSFLLFCFQFLHSCPCCCIAMMSFMYSYAHTRK